MNKTRFSHVSVIIAQIMTRSFVVAAFQFVCCLLLNAADAQTTTPVITTNNQLLNEIYAWVNGNFNNRAAIGTWDVSRLEDFNYAFQNQQSFNDDISQWNVSAAKSMEAMFGNAKAFNKDISGWQVQSVTNMKSMFENATVFNQNISGWNVHSVMYMDFMFWNAKAFNQEISSWNVHKVRDMKFMFYGAQEFNKNISDWSVESITDFSYMFYDALAFNQDLCLWGTQLPSSAFAYAAFYNSGCPISSNPDLSASPPGPFCHDCGTINPPTTAPLPDPPSTYPGLCFSTNVEINVQGIGKTRMDKLAVGDMVLTKSGTYKPVYMISHFNSSKPFEFVQITSNVNKQIPIELSPNHLLFLDGKEYPVPAAQVRVGDKVCSIDGIKEVTAVNKITREGLYNPITTDGTIVVDELFASTFTSYSGETHIKIHGICLVSMHTMMSIASGPYGLLCQIISFGICNQHDELAGVTMIMQQLHDFWLKQNELWKFIIMVVYLLIFGSVSILGNHCFIILAFILLTWKMRININKKKAGESK